MDTNETDNIRVQGYGNGKLTIVGFSHDSEEKAKAAFQAGASWIRVEDGKLEAIPAFNSLPDPIDDELMLPFWRKESTSDKTPKGTVEVPLKVDENYNSAMASITIQSLCGYRYTREKYRMEAEKLRSYGFDCLRSQRGKDASFWEIWYLPGTWCAKGKLKESFGGEKDEKKKLKLALAFLRENVMFGTLDVSIQRLAMPNPD